MSLIHLWLLLSTELSRVLSIPGLAFTKCDSAFKNELTFSAFLEKKEKLNTCFCNGRVWICCLHDIKGNILFNWCIPYLPVLFVIVLLRYLIIFLCTTLVWNFLIVISGQVSQQIYLYPELQSLFYHRNLYLKSTDLTFIIRPHANWKLVLNPYKLNNLIYGSVMNVRHICS